MFHILFCFIHVLYNGTTALKKIYFERIHLHRTSRFSLCAFVLDHTNHLFLFQLFTLLLLFPSVDICLIWKRDSAWHRSFILHWICQKHSSPLLPADIHIKPQTIQLKWIYWVLRSTSVERRVISSPLDGCVCVRVWMHLKRKKIHLILFYVLL